MDTIGAIPMAVRIMVMRGIEAVEMPQQCECGTPLIFEEEIEFGVCERCADAAYARYTERKEWEYYHPSDDAAD